MGRQRANGVDAAIALLKALVACDGAASGRELAAEIRLPRSSFHRIVRTLVAAGLLTSRRGVVGVGPLAGSFIATSVERMRTERGAHASRPQWAAVRVAALDPAEGRGPIALAKPMRTTPRAGRLRIGFSNISLDNPWRIALVHSIEHAASGLGKGIARLAVRHAENDAQTQAEHIRELVEEDVDGLIVSAAPSPLVREAIETAMSRGIEVVMVDRRLPDAEPTCFVSTSDVSIGQTTALWLAEILAGTGAILLLPGREEAEPAQIRLAAAKSVFARYPQIEFVGVEWTGWQRQAGYQAAARAIERFGHRIAGVWCDSGLQGVGSLQAFINAGWKTGHIPPHTGGDLNLVYKLAIKHEVKLAAVDYPPAMGIRAVEVLFAALHGHYVPKRIEVASDVIVTRGAATASVKPHLWAEDHVRWDLPNDLVLASGLGPAYNPCAFRIHYPGNSYNRSAARPVQRSGP
jgi:ABC-type sugar transport system substrate-binding protein